VYKVTEKWRCDRRGVKFQTGWNSKTVNRC
jgi:hypothetical protein